MTKLEEFSSTSTAQRIGLALVAISLVVGALPVDAAYAETKAPVSIEMQVASADNRIESDLVSFPKLHREVVQRRQACSAVVSDFEAGSQRIADIAADPSMSPPDRLAAMIDVAQTARNAAVELKVEPDPWRTGVDMPFAKDVDSVAHHLKDSIRDYIGNARGCIRESDQYLKALNSPTPSPDYHSRADHGHHGSSGRSLTDNILSIRRTPFSH